MGIRGFATWDGVQGNMGCWNKLFGTVSVVCGAREMAVGMRGILAGREVTGYCLGSYGFGVMAESVLQGAAGTVLGASDGLPKFKYQKEHLCPLCEQRKSKRASHPPKPVPNSRQRLHLFHMDLCGPMRLASINEKCPVIIVRTKNGTEFKNHALKEYFDSVGIIHKTSVAKTPQQNGVIERRNRTLVEAVRTMLIFSHAPLFLWAEAFATAFFTRNHSIIHLCFNKTSYELIKGRKPDISYLHVFGALCYPKNDHEDIDKLGAKGDIGFFIGYFANFVSYRGSFGDMIDIGLDVIHPVPVAIVSFPTAAVVRTLSQHGEAIRGIQEHLLGVSILEELMTLRFRVDIAKAEITSPRTRIRTME
nr:retrovirus-related Pol polyprotein from transposon TNT 1-94 [Tanacetum cinerariifolium]